MYTSTFGLGQSLGFPDVCLTPPFAIPIPYPNIGMNAMAIPTYFTAVSYTHLTLPTKRIV